MEWPEFVASLVKTLAWPLAALGIALLFKKELSAVLGRLTHVKVPGGEARFGAGVAQVERSVAEFKETAPTGVSPDDVPIRPEDDSVDPSGLVLRSWEEFGRSLFQLRDATLPSAIRSRNPSFVLQQLEESGIVNSLFVRSARELRTLRNDVAHSRETPTRGAAIVYADQARELTAAAHVFAKMARAKTQPE